MIFHERREHFEIDYHIVREKVQVRVIQTQHIASAIQPADMCTKSLAAGQLCILLSKLGLYNKFKILNLRGML